MIAATFDQPRLLFVGDADLIASSHSLANPITLEYRRSHSEPSSIGPPAKNGPPVLAATKAIFNLMSREDFWGVF